MSGGERFREWAFAILFTIASIIMLIGMITTGDYEKTGIGLGMFGVLALFSWIKLLVNS